MTGIDHLMSRGTSERRIASRPRRVAPAGAGLLLLALLGACATPLADEAARAAARSAVNPVLARQFPGVPLAPATNCVIGNASATEILSLAASARGGVTEASTRLVLDIVRRPDTLNCLATDGLPALLQTLQEA